MQVPGVPVWENLTAPTSYTGRNFAIRKLQLGPELIVEKLNFDASKRSKKRGSAQLKLRAFGGAAALRLGVDERFTAVAGGAIRNLGSGAVGG